jgi:MFS family permease
MPPTYLRSAAIIAGVAILQAANGLLGLLLPVELTAAGASGAVVGAVASANGLGFLLGCLGAPRLVRRVGHIRAFTALAALCASLTLLFLATRQPWAWIALRLVTGLGLAGLFSTVEGWLAATTPGESRGRVLGLYLVATKLATVLGQVLIGTGLFHAAALFVVASGLFSLALIPVALTRTAEPEPPRLVSLQLGALWRIAPASVVGCASAGLLNSAVAGLVPAWGAGLGLPVSLVVTLAATMQVGSLAMQWPLGWLSDRTDRRQVILACASAVAGLSLAIAALGGTLAPAALTLLFLVWGGFSMSFYGVCVAHASDHASPEAMVRVSSSALFAWAMGSTTGPLLAAPALDRLGPAGLFLYATAISGALALFVAWRMTRRAPVPVEAREAFVNLPATSPRLADIDPRSAGREPPGQAR